MAHGFAVWGGPVATIIASFTAAGVAVTFGYFQYRLGVAQKEIARSQKDIAHERLKSDLFDRRYKIYAAMRDASLHCIRKAHNSEWSAVIQITEEVETCVFIFGDSISDWMLESREVILRFALECEILRNTPQELWEYQEVLKNHRKGQRAVADIFYSLPKKLRGEMGINAITPPDKA
jgi:hypothetical protein